MTTIPPNTPGIYQITCLANGKIYIGSAIRLRARWNQHRAGLAAKRHANSYLQHAWDRYGADAFEFKILELVPHPQALIAREQHYIDLLRPYIRSIGFNMTRAAGSTLGRVFSKGTREKLSDRARHRMPPTTETRAKMSSALQGRTFTPEHRQKIAASNRRRTLSPETRKKISETKQGRALSIEHRQKIAQGVTKALQQRQPEQSDFHQTTLFTELDN